jgi:2OG-Fe(II) oxygenase superfamily
VAIKYSRLPAMSTDSIHSTASECMLMSVVAAQAKPFLKNSTVLDNKSHRPTPSKVRTSAGMFFRRGDSRGAPHMAPTQLGYKRHGRCMCTTGSALVMCFGVQQARMRCSAILKSVSPRSHTCRWITARACRWCLATATQSSVLPGILSSCPIGLRSRHLPGLHCVQVLNYHNGQEYQPHHDFFHDGFPDRGSGQRIATVLMYLCVPVHPGVLYNCLLFECMSNVGSCSGVRAAGLGSCLPRSILAVVKDNARGGWRNGVSSGAPPHARGRLVGLRQEVSRYRRTSCEAVHVFRHKDRDSCLYSHCMKLEHQLHVAGGMPSRQPGGMPYSSGR